MKEKIIGLIPVRLASKRLPNKALLPIANFPLIVHVFKRAQLSKKLDDLIVCCDDMKIFKTIKKFNVKAMMTSKKHTNGTERIAEAYKKLKKKYSLIVDIQGDEPLLDPKQIDNVINFHMKNKNADIVVPSLKIKKNNNKNIVKIIKDKNNHVMYFSRSALPFNFRKKTKYSFKHLSIISFKPNSLEKFSKSKPTHLEQVEGIELMRALEIGLKLKSPNLRGDSFSVDVKKDYQKAKKKFKKDRIYKMYNSL